jgi:hypothetical protein
MLAVTLLIVVEAWWNSKYEIFGILCGIWDKIKE